MPLKSNLKAQEPINRKVSKIDDLSKKLYDLITVIMSLLPTIANKESEIHHKLTNNAKTSVEKEKNKACLNRFVFTIKKTM